MTTDAIVSAERVRGIRRAGAVRRLVRNRSAFVAALVLLALAAAAALAPLFWPYDPQHMDFAARLQAPSPAHPLGTDEFGRDVLHAVVHGGRVSLLAGFLVVVMAAGLGTAMALAAGASGTMDYALSRLTDLWLALPSLLLAMVIVATLGTGVANAMLAVAISSIPGYFRLVRSEVLALRSKEFVEAARAVGATETRVMIRHILPNIIPTMLVISTLQFGGAILSLSSLSFLGLGAAPPTPEWGAMISSGRDYLREAIWLVAAPGVAVVAAVLALNILGDGLRDVLDPRMRRW